MDDMFGMWQKKDLLNKTRVKDFIKTYARKDNWHSQDLRNGGLGYGWTHYSLIRLLKSKKVLCVGSKYGFIPAVCALACKDNEKGIVDFVDAGYDINDYEGMAAGEHWGGEGFWKKCDAKKYFGKFDLQDNINLFVMTTETFFKKYKKNRYGYVHIDGDHSYKGVKTDFEMFWPMVEKGGFLAIHDIGSPDKNGNVYGTRDFWKEIKKTGKYKLIEIKEDPGVGIIQKG